MPAPKFSDEELLTICEIANVVACECPAHLIGLLRDIRRFRRYTTECVQTFPEQAETHEWLDREISDVEALLSSIIFEFMKREELLDEHHQLDLDKLASRNHAAVLKQF